MNETHGYREDAREKRRAIIAFPKSLTRWFGPILAGLFAAGMLYAGASVAEREVTFRCTRDERGEGSCEHVIGYLATHKRETFDVRELRSARVERGQGKSGPTYRTFVNVGGAERQLGDSNGNQDQERFAHALDRFAHDPEARAFDDGYVSQQFVLVLFFFALFAAVGVTVAIIARISTAPRRLVLDENANTATLERKPLRRWNKLWAVSLDSVRGARFVLDDKGFRSVVVDTTADGPLLASVAVGESDATVAEITRFLNRDPS